MIASKTPHAQTYSYSKLNQSLDAARLYYKQGAYDKAFDSFCLIYKNAGLPFETPDLHIVGQCLVSLFEYAYENNHFSEQKINYLCANIDKLQNLQLNEDSIEFMQKVLAPLLSCIEKDLNHHPHSIKIIACYRTIIEHINNSAVVPVSLEQKLKAQEQIFFDNIMKKIKAWYEQQLYTLASIQAENEIKLLNSFYPTLAKQLIDESIILFKRHHQCPKKIIAQLTANTCIPKEV